MKKIAVYAGSFDPFHNGHLAIIKKAVKIFDEVHIVIASNAKKDKRQYSASRILDAIEDTLKNENINNCVVLIHRDLVADYAMKIGAQHLIRGLRNNMDYNYEENMAQGHKLTYPELETIYLRADETALSSSLIKELNSYDADVSGFVPEAVYKILRTKSQ